MRIRTAAAWAAIFCAAATTTVRASVVTTGDVAPDPATSTPTTDVYVGNTADGAVTVNAGSTVTASTAYLGFGPGVTGTVAVTGGGSTWAGDLYVGFDGAASLQVSNGGTLRGMGYIGMDAGSTGAVTLTGAGTQWTQGIGGIYVGDQGAGTLSVLNGATASSDSGYVGHGPGGSGAATVDGPGSSWTGMTGGLYVGNLGTGTLSITHGAVVSGHSGYVGGLDTGAPGTVIIDGPASAWTDNRDGIYVGNGEAGSIRITRGGTLESGFGYIGSSAPGSVSIDGHNSHWTNADLFDIDDASTLDIFNGATATGTGLSIDDPASLLSMTVGDGSALQLSGPGAITNHGTIRLAAAPAATPGTYTPITTSAAFPSWGAVQALGGTWNPAAATFTISAPATGTAGSPVTIDPSQTQRITITDPSTGHAVTAAFLSPAASSTLTFTAIPADPTQTTALELASDQTPLAAWTFSAQGYTPGEPVYLSLLIGSGYSDDTLFLWHYDGSAWTPYSPTDFTYDGTYANFTVTGFSGYAVTAVPEPTTFTLLLAATLPTVRRRHRRG